MARLSVLKRFLPILLLLLLLLPLPGLAQRAVGVEWDVPNRQEEVANDLRLFVRLGISHLLINRALDDQKWRAIQGQELTVYGTLPIAFPIVQTFSRADSAFTAKMRRLSNHFGRREEVKAIGLVSFPGPSDEPFRKALASFIQNLPGPARGKPHYYITARTAAGPIDSLFDFKIVYGADSSATARNEAGNTLYRYKPDPAEPLALRPVKQFLENTSGRPGQPVFFNGHLLKELVRAHPDFASIVRSYTSSRDPVFPLPEQPPGPAFNVDDIIVFLLLMAWILFGLTYNYNPVYRKSFRRYFTGHTFFIQDIMDRHIRTLFSGFSILLQHAIAGGIVFFCLFHITFSPLGHRALLTHYPALAAFGTAPWSLLLWGILFTLLAQLVCIAWLWAANSGITHLSQVINLYPWPLQLNLITSTFTAAFFFGGENETAIYLFSAIFMIIFVSTFPLTVFDTLPHENKRPRLFVAGTVGLYIILLFGTAAWIAASPALVNVAALALELP